MYSKSQLEVIWATDFESKEAARWWSAKEGETAGGRGDAERAEWMGEGLFVHASNSLGVISIASSIIVPFEEGQKKNSVQHRKLPLCHMVQRGGFQDLWSTMSPFLPCVRLLAVVDSNQSTLILCSYNPFMRQQLLSVAVDWLSVLLRSTINLPILHMSLQGPFHFLLVPWCDLTCDLLSQCWCDDWLHQTTLGPHLNVSLMARSFPVRTKLAVSFVASLDWADKHRGMIMMTFTVPIKLG